ncbi:hypothetical protein AGR13a_Lc120126 [Agrobacterium genomosp. 13 str. CFBP 6927]|uniref:Uncharacterized protein n=1 Tax=Agrobacterium genomosp. 13 str. CFBP 6927 TaxID=1183428 RepID=A0ABM9VKK2_9HYPH|nr:hypothetical protein AGR13a_Lc120126 [Agrobacterium genomosp. 13 str. CFBP 6927]
MRKRISELTFSILIKGKLLFCLKPFNYKTRIVWHSNVDRQIELAQINRFLNHVLLKYTRSRVGFCLFGKVVQCNYLVSDINGLCYREIPRTDCKGDVC